MKQLGEILSTTAEHFPASRLITADCKESITYSHLAQKAAQLASQLTQLGSGPSQRMGIFLPKSIDSVTAIFGTLQSGAAYVPADVHAPVTRAEYIFEDSQVKFIITNDEYSRELYPDFARVNLPETSFLLIINELPSQEVIDVPVNLAYVLYTSGSTGHPKGVMITHKNALSFIEWAGKEFNVNEQDTLTSIAPFHFDLSIFDLFVSINRGANLVLIDAKTAKNPRLLAEVIAQRGVSLLYATPSLLQLLLRFGKLDDHDYSRLQTVLFAGEVFPVAALSELQNKWPVAIFFNLYGPTETNVVTWYCVQKLQASSFLAAIPIGHSCPFTRCALLIDDRSSFESGREGELIVAGPSVAAGYLGKQSGAMSTFIDEHLNHWYRTGDLVTIDADGAFTFRGRIDRMIKRRGYRIEPAEIERALLQHVAIDQAVVISYLTPKEEVKIQAFLVSAIGQEVPDFLELKQFCQRNLPLYMLPDGFKFLPEIPQTSSQKIDYQRLKALTNA